MQGDHGSKKAFDELVVTQEVACKVAVPGAYEGIVLFCDLTRSQQSKGMDDNYLHVDAN